MNVDFKFNAVSFNINNKINSTSFFRLTFKLRPWDGRKEREKKINAKYSRLTHSEFAFMSCLCHWGGVNDFLAAIEDKKLLLREQTGEKHAKVDRIKHGVESRLWCNRLYFSLLNAHNKLHKSAVCVAQPPHGNKQFNHGLFCRDWKETVAKFGFLDEWKKGECVGCVTTWWFMRSRPVVEPIRLLTACSCFRKCSMQDHWVVT